MGNIHIYPFKPSLVVVFPKCFVGLFFVFQILLFPDSGDAGPELVVS